MLKKAILSTAYQVTEPKRDDLPFVKCIKCGKMLSIIDAKSTIASDGEVKYYCNNCIS